VKSFNAAPALSFCLLDFLSVAGVPGGDFFQVGRRQPPQLQPIFTSNWQKQTSHDNHTTIITVDIVSRLAILFFINEAYNLRRAAADTSETMLQYSTILEF
jgi:hypothetical protein